MAEATFEQVRRKHDSLERRYHQLLKELDPATDKKSKNVATLPYGESEAHTRRVFSHDGATSRYGEPEATLARRFPVMTVFAPKTLYQRSGQPPPRRLIGLVTMPVIYQRSGQSPPRRLIGLVTMPVIYQCLGQNLILERQTAFAENERQTAFAESERQTAFAESEWQTAFAESERQTEFGESDPRRKRRLDAARLKRYNKQTLDLAFLQKDLIVDFDTPEAISTGLKRLKTYGGGDLAEDVLGGYANVLVLSWSSRYRVLIHFGDAPPHGKKFHTIPAGGNVKSYDRFYTVDPPYPGAKGQEWLDDLTRQLCEKSIFTNFFAFHVVEWCKEEIENASSEGLSPGNLRYITMMEEVSFSMVVMAVLTYPKAPRHVTPNLFIDVAFLVDVTASMQTWIDAVYDKLDSIIDAINRTWPFVVMRTAFIGYRDYGDAQQLVLKDFENNPDEMKRFVRTVKATGGDDTAEDVLGGMDALRTLSWKSKVRIVFHVGDAPAHGTRFHKSHVQDLYPRGDPRGLVAEDVLRGIYEKGIIYYFLKLNDSTDQMIEVFNVMSSFKGK
ncbi:hypothetical protein BC938DRAFT_479062 [Jimgerdemannia flammicorona]|uniref:VWFA domain-containing protein n=1 Tax=Jimgerdemannia flammicorona TaxID=994334 RepID=A0A433QLQ9_9FUNG|nr:hypothetical protein BC938DRAFT_479062 [Jimgerdemannia flammicorona]